MKHHTEGQKLLSASQFLPCLLKEKYFFFSGSLAVQGYRRPLQFADLWPLRAKDSSDGIMKDLEKFWSDNRKKLR